MRFLKKSMNSNSKKYKYLLTNIIAFLCGNLGTKLISFFMVPLYTNILKPSEYGEIDLILSIVGVISPFIACGIHEGVMRFCLDRNSNKKLVLSIGLRTFIISSIIFIFICPLFLFIPILSNYIIFVYLYSVLNEIMTIFLCYIRGKDDIKLYSFLGFLSGFITALLNILFLVFLKWGLFGYQISMLLSPLITTIVAIILGQLVDDISISQWDNSLAKEMMRYSLILIPNSLLWWCINASDRFFVSYMCGTAMNGLYAVSYKIPTLLNTVSTIFMQSWQMSAIKEFENGNESQFYDQIYKQIIFFMGISTLILMCLNKLILSLYVGNEYKAAWIFSPFLIISFFAGSLSTFWGSFYIAAKKMDKYLHSAIIGALVNILLNFYLIRQIGALGAAISTMICYIIVLIVRAKSIEAIINLKFFNKELFSIIICLSIALSVSYLPNILNWIFNILNICFYLFFNRKFIGTMIMFIKRFFQKYKGYKED